MPKQNQKTVPYPVRLNEEEAAAFRAYSEKCGITRATLVRQFIRETINQEPDLLADEMREFRQAITELSAIGRNLNQMTKAVNAGNLSPQFSEAHHLNSLSEHVTQVKASLQDYLLNSRQRLVKTPS